MVRGGPLEGRARSDHYGQGAYEQLPSARCCWHAPPHCKVLSGPSLLRRSHLQQSPDGLRCGVSDHPRLRRGSSNRKCKKDGSELEATALRTGIPASLRGGGSLDWSVWPGGIDTQSEDRKSTRLNSSHRCISY